MLARHVFAILDALGFDIDGTPIELMLTEQGTQLIEINARLLGATLPRLLDLR